MEEMESRAPAARKIAILACGKVDCTAGGCLNAFYDRRKAFERYRDEDLRLTAFMRCPGCLGEQDPMTSESFVKKLERIAGQAPVTLHISHCAKKRGDEGCPAIGKMAAAFAEKGVEIVWGTH